MLSTCIIFACFMGLIIGSFLNVVVIRYGTGRSVGGRSMCMTCGHQLAWYELIPVFSYLFQRGKCTHCHAKISPRYATVEILCSALFGVAAWYMYPALFELSLTLWFIIFCVMAAFWAIMLAISAYDIRHTIIPDGMLAVAAGLTVAWVLIRLIALPEASWIPSYIYLDLLAGLVCALPFAALWLVSKGAWMGFGDAKLIFVLGTFLGFNQSVTFICLAFWAGALFGLMMIATNALRKTKAFGAKTEVPFAPFLIGAAAFVFFFNLHLADLLEVWAWVLY